MTLKLGGCFHILGCSVYLRKIALTVKADYFKNYFSPGSCLQRMQDIDFNKRMRVSAFKSALDGEIRGSGNRYRIQWVALLFEKGIKFCAIVKLPFPVNSFPFRMFSFCLIIVFLFQRGYGVGWGAGRNFACRWMITLEKDQPEKWRSFSCVRWWESGFCGIFFYLVIFEDVLWKVFVLTEAFQ